MENQQQRQKEARGRNAVQSRRVKGLYKSRSFPRGRVAHPGRTSWGVISDLWGDFGASKGSGAAFDGERWAVAVWVGLLAPMVGVSAGWIAERTRKITVKGQMRGSY